MVENKKEKFKVKEEEVDVVSMIAAMTIIPLIMGFLTWLMGRYAPLLVFVAFSYLGYLDYKDKKENGSSKN